jgi:hypothetical protein
VREIRTRRVELAVENWPRKVLGFENSFSISGLNPRFQIYFAFK